MEWIDTKGFLLDVYIMFGMIKEEASRQINILYFILLWKKQLSIKNQLQRTTVFVQPGSEKRNGYF